MKGILFKAEVWKAKQQVLDQYGEPQTRRVEAALKGINLEPDSWILGGWDNGYKAFIFYSQRLGAGKRIIKPRYHIGETIYIKEAWTVFDCIGTLAGIKYTLDDFVTWVHIPASKANPKVGYHSPILMPEYAARHFITIADVRAERLQEITEEDAIVEGIKMGRVYVDEPKPDGMAEDVSFTQARFAYGQLWNSINPKYPWESNPLVFAYTFRRAE